MSEETRAEIARQRLAQLAATFEAEFTGAPERGGPEHRSRRQGLSGRHLRAVLVVATAAMVLLTWWLIAGRTRQSSASEPLALTPSSAVAASSSTASASAATSGAELVIDVVGKVRKPGIVTLPAGSRVHEAITAAGGALSGVDTSNLNLARKLADGEQIVVGATATAPTTGGSSSGATTGALVNLNTADLAALDSLPGIGPVTAQAIIDWRTKNGSFTSVDDLLEVKGIGDATLADLRDLVTV